MMVLRYFSGLSADDEAKRFSVGGRRKTSEVVWSSISLIKFTVQMDYFCSGVQPDIASRCKVYYFSSRRRGLVSI